jgi:hypothetical protein
MKHIEVHVLESDADIAPALNIGLLTLADLDDGAKCSACSEKVAYVNGVFTPFAVGLDEMDEPWLMCITCIEALLAPEEADTTSLDELFLVDEEFDDFDLEDDD